MEAPCGPPVLFFSFPFFIFTSLVVALNGQLVCWQALLRCHQERDCELAYNQYLTACDGNLRGMRRQCPSHCVGALIRLNQTASGPGLETCDCGQDVECRRAKKAIEPCLPRTHPGGMGCTEARQRCEENPSCQTSLTAYLSSCGQLFNGRKCSARCKATIEELLFMPDGVLLDKCICDGVERPFCEVVKENMVRLCSVGDRGAQTVQESLDDAYEDEDYEGKGEREKDVDAVVQYSGAKHFLSHIDPHRTTTEQNRPPNQNYPANSVLWAASCGQRPVGSVLWAESCGQRPVATDKEQEDDRHCTVQQLALRVSQWLCGSPSVCTGLPVSVRVCQCLYGSPSVCTGLPVSVRVSQCLCGSPSVCAGLPVSVRVSQCLCGSPSGCAGLPVAVQVSQCLCGSPSGCADFHPQSEVQSGRCPQDTAPQDAAHRTLPTGHCPQDTGHRTLATGRCPTGHCPTGHSFFVWWAILSPAALLCLIRSQQHHTHQHTTTTTPNDVAQTHKAMDPSCQQSHVQAAGGSILVWHVFSWQGLGQLVRLNMSLTGVYYVSLLSDHLQHGMDFRHSSAAGHLNVTAGPTKTIQPTASCGQRPVGSVLWAASCGQRPVGQCPVGSVLWAESCGQLPVSTDEGLEDQHCTVQQQMSYRL
ncbi:hypothetical protein NFI96_007378 [Prochilodus magdalenae]|nr:hypothetical protein NFI96_007378 [Prochilodus magdalenae]